MNMAIREMKLNKFGVRKWEQLNHGENMYARS